MGLTSFLVASVLFGVPRQEEVRDWEFRAGRWETVAGVLSQELGQPVRVHERVRDEVVIGRFVQKSAEEMIRAFSEAILTVWTDQGGTIVIQPDGRRREAEERGFRQRQAETLRRNIRTVLDQPYTQDAVDAAVKTVADAGGTIRKLDVYSPYVRMAYEILETVGPDELLGGDERRIVYAANPTPLQKGLGAQGDQIIGRLKRYMAIRHKSQDLAPGNSQYSNINLLRDSHHPDQLKDVLVSLRVGGPVPSIMLIGFDQENNSFFFSQANVFATHVVNEEGVVVVGADKDGTKVAWEGTVKVDNRDAEYAAIHQWHAQLGQPGFSVRQVYERLATFREEDPLSRTVTDLLFLASKVSGKDVAGRVSDSLLTVIPFSRPGDGAVRGQSSDIRLQQLENYMSGYYEGVLRETDSMLVVGRTMADLSNPPVNRTLVSRLARAMLDDGEISFDLWADVAARTATRGEFEGLVGLFQKANLGARVMINMQVGGNASQSNYEALKLYGSLPQSVRNRVRREPVEIAVAGLSPAAREVLMQNLTFHYGRPGVIGASGDGWTRDPAAIERQRGIQAKYGGWASEPTFILAQPEAQPLVLTVSFVQEDRLIAHWPEGMTAQASIDFLAQEEVTRLKAAEQGASRSRSGTPVYLVPESTRLDIRIRAGDMFEALLSCDVPARETGEFVPFEQLPASIRSAFAEAKKVWAERYKDTQFGGGASRQTVTPP